MQQFFLSIQKTLNLALPIILTSLISAATGLISMYLMSLLGTHALAAGALIFSTYSFLIMIAVSFLYPIGILTSQKYGAGRNIEIGALIQQGFIVATLMSVVLMLVMQHLYSIFIFLNQPKDTAFLAAKYFQSLMYGVLPSLWIAILNQFLTGILKPKIMTWFSFISIFLIAAMGYVLQFGLFGLPSLGISAVAVASSITSWLMFILFIVYLGIKKEFKLFNLFPLSFLPNMDVLIELFQMGWPISIQYGAELLAFTFMTYLIGSFGSDALAAQQITLQCAVVAIMFMMGFSQATSILISQAFGQKDFKAMRQQFHASLLLSLVPMCFIALVFLFSSQIIIQIFLNIKDPANNRILQIATVLLTIVAFTQIADCIRNVTTGALRGLKDVRFPAMIALISCWLIALPLSVLAMSVVDAPGVRIGFMIGITVGAIVVVRRFYHQLAYHEALHESTAALEEQKKAA